VTAGRDAHFSFGTFEGKHEQLQLPFGPSPERGIPSLRHGARTYAESQGLSYSAHGLSEIQSDPIFQTRVAKAYETAPQGTHRVRKAYEAFAHETRQQYDYLTRPQEHGGLGVKVEVVDQDPYRHHGEMISDLQRNNRLRVLSTKTTGSHPYLSDEENDMFRAVHDAFGHAAIGRSFSRHGEEAAFHSHVQMYSPHARQAMAAETRGQNSAFIYRSGGGKFPEQKLVQMPDWTMRNRVPRR
jgi:hypothetical protein